jgi:class 3 adenylate cyclase/tetratricopeptide (TPR) repeat protein
MFCDLVGSTALSQELDPEDLADLIREFQGAAAEAIAAMGGYIARYMGDGILAYFGYPTAYEDNAERAMRAGLGCIDAVQRLDAGLGRSLSARVGIATGLVVVGELIGEGASEENTALGQTPNLAARLQGVAEPNQVVVDSTTQRLAGRSFALDALIPQRLKGIDEPVSAWVVLEERASQTRFEAIDRQMVDFVGREPELHLLRSRWNQAANGEGQVVFLSGEAGIGKSRLVQTFRDHITDVAHSPMRFQCSPYHTNSALYPILRQLEWAAEMSPGDSGSIRLEKLENLLRPTAEDLDSVVPVVADLMSLPFQDRYGSMDLNPQQRMDRIFAALTEQLLRLADVRPVCCVIEDAHWIDPTSNELVEHFASHIVDAPVLLLITHRPEWIAQWAGNHSHTVSLSLGRLSREEVRGIVRTIMGVQTDDDLVERIVSRTDGVPLFVEELSNSVLESSKGGPFDDAEVPESLQSSLLSRLDRLGEAKEIAQIGAVFGRQFEYDLLVAVAGWAESSLRLALERLVESQLMFRRGIDAAAAYIFKHALVQDAAYDSLLRRKRQQLHLRIAQTMEQVASTRSTTEPELLAHHFTEAGHFEQGLSYWRQAGEDAAARSNNLEAAAQFQKALGVLNRLPATRERDEQELALSLSMASALINAKGYRAPEAEPAYARAVELCERLGDEVRVFPALFGRYLSNVMDGNFGVGLGWAKQFLRRAEDQPDEIIKLLGHRVMAPALCGSGQPRSSLDHCRKGLALYDPERDKDAYLEYGSDFRAYFSWVASWSSWLVGFPDQAMRYVETGAEWAREIDHPNSMAMVSGWGGCVVHSLCRLPERVEVHAALTEKIRRDHDLRMWPITARPFLEVVRLERGPDELLIRQLRESCEALKQQRARLYLPYLLSRLADALRRAGDFDLALEALDDAQRQVDIGGERWSEAEIPRVRGEVFHDLSRISEAVHQFENALSIARLQEAKSLELRATTSLARLWGEQSRRQEARAVLAPVYDWFTEGFGTPDLIDAKEVLAQLA